VRRLEALRAERAARRERLGNVRLALESGERSGRLVAELEGVTKRFGDRTIVRDLTLNVMRGDRLALIGPNGAGKTTLIKLILGQMLPDTGSMRLGTNLEIAYFDQMRAALDETLTLAETISPGSEWIESAGQRRHVLSYLGDFLFPPQRAQAPVSTLSGGERNRLLLARLFAKPANLLVLDEPTNDLDIESLELLEETLQAYPGTLLLVSHDRAFLDNIATQSLVAEGDGVWREYAGGYSDWLAQRPAPSAVCAPKAGARATRIEDRRDRPSKPGLTYKEQRELDALPGQIEALEAEQHALTQSMCAPGYHQRGPDALRADRQRAESIEHALAEKFERWAALDAKAAAKASR
jgi:ATP-binding cassette subfamily F protein uup